MKSRNSKWALMDKYIIPNVVTPERGYVTRWRVIQTPLAAIYVHRFTSFDEQCILHDHPWPFASIIVKGRGYTEMRLDPVTMETKERYVRRLNVHRAGDFDWITGLLSPVVWSVLLVGRRRKTWGFLEKPAPHYVTQISPPAKVDLNDGAWKFTPWDKHRSFVGFRPSSQRK